MSIWHLIVHIIGADGGVKPYGKWNWYFFDSGFGNGSWLLTIGIVAIPVYWHHQCHVKGCLRIARYPVAGGQFKVCKHHHPDLQGSEPTLAHITNLHWKWKREQDVTNGSMDLVSDRVRAFGPLYPSRKETDQR